MLKTLKSYLRDVLPRWSVIVVGTLGGVAVIATAVSFAQQNLQWLGLPWWLWPLSALALASLFLHWAQYSAWKAARVGAVEAAKALVESGAEIELAKPPPHLLANAELKAFPVPKNAPTSVSIRIAFGSDPRFAAVFVKNDGERDVEGLVAEVEINGVDRSERAVWSDAMGDKLDAQPANGLVLTPGLSRFLLVAIAHSSEIDTFEEYEWCLLHRDLQLLDYLEPDGVGSQSKAGRSAIVSVRLRGRCLDQRLVFRLDFDQAGQPRLTPAADPPSPRG